MNNPKLSDFVAEYRRYFNTARDADATGEARMYADYILAELNEYIPFKGHSKELFIKSIMNNYG
nr:MAG TPA: hypothetical protein [Caudoviricetes sp.]